MSLEYNIGIITVINGFSRFIRVAAAAYVRQARLMHAGCILG